MTVNNKMDMNGNKNVPYKDLVDEVRNNFNFPRTGLNQYELLSSEIGIAHFAGS